MRERGKREGHWVFGSVLDYLVGSRFYVLGYKFQELWLIYCKVSSSGIVGVWIQGQDIMKQGNAQNVKY